MLLSLWFAYGEDWPAGPTPVPENTLAPNGGALREYQPTYHELRENRALERKIEEARIDLTLAKNKIDDLEFRRLGDLADKDMQVELLQLLSDQHWLQQRLDILQQRKLKVIGDDDEFLALIMCLPI